ncbi:hypothetical protein CEP51_006870 [Fusarium floridanum]|uniref:NACHT domain-containing protein n=1 Tax=Fusarium floridanum TaxID=1325733 RepID=A0A428RRF8_9HYPO|nr:hypothetical protein CEP51_006870 [Fusarium floridanum]
MADYDDPLSPLPLLESTSSTSPSGQRHSAPALLRGRWRSRIRSSISGSQISVAKPTKTKGPTGLNLLYEPSESRVDFIFIHGLQGDSRKTWCYDAEDESSFWPKEWLPYEAGFRYARIHSFGYESEWSKGGRSPLMIHDFAQALLTDMSNSISLQRNGPAYLLGSRDPLHKSMIGRVHTFYFLGTPHRGANSAIYLDYYLKLSHPTGAKEYAKELLPDSPTVQAINDEFRHIPKTVHLWSFYESIPTSGQIIVPQTSAVIGLPGEQARYLNADHRHLCKFEDSNSSNFATLYRCLQTTIQDIDKDCKCAATSLMKTISDYLEVSERPTKDVLTEAHKRHGGSCEWLTSHDKFQEWVDCNVNDDLDIGPLDTSPIGAKPRLLWLNGPPGSGKSVAAAHVIKHLEGHNEDCSYYFFKNNSKATVTHLLRSLAFQMAWINYGVRQSFISMIEEGYAANTHDHTVIWNNIFLGRIFKCNFSKPQYWVIDALDECPNKSLVAFIQMFAKLNVVPLRVFATSRTNTHLGRLLDREHLNFPELHTGQEGSLRDISNFVRSQPRLAQLGGEGEIVSEIVKRSNGVFLWASLILDRLDDLYSVEDMLAELIKTPPEMNRLYARILGETEQSSSAELAKCIIKWVVCAAEPLTTSVIKVAVKFDCGRTILASEPDHVFSQICKGLVTVDSESHVQVMHPTVKDFVSSSDSSFYINLREAHETMAAICLQNLNDRKFDPRFTGRGLLVPSASGSNLDDYADANFAYHMAHSHSTSPHLFSLLVKFMDSTILTWVERVALKQRLSPLIKTVEHLKTYLARHECPPFGKASDWVNELTRLVTIFGPYLIDVPQTIRTVIPLLCPTSSRIHQTFANRCRSKLICSSNVKWDDRLSALLLSAKPRSLASNQRYLAVGLSNGKIRLFNNSTLEMITTLNHYIAAKSVPVQLLLLGNTTKVLVSCGPRNMKLWKLPDQEIWNIRLKAQVRTISFNADDSKLFVAYNLPIEEAISTLSATDGSEIEPVSVIEGSSDSDQNPTDWASPSKRYVLSFVRMNPILGFAAVAYRSSHLMLFQLDGDDNLEQICKFKKTGTELAVRPPQVLDVAFNPAVESALMAVAYQDGEIVTVEVGGWGGGNTRQRNAYSLHATLLASSPDGRTLGAVDNEGGICLFNFDNLRILHRIQGLDEVATGIMFASNSLRLYDIRGTACNVWEPSVLMRKHSVDDDSSDPGDSAQPSLDAPGIFFTRPFDDDRVITVITQSDENNFVFCGRENGSVTIHDVSSGKQVFEMHLHTASIRHLEWQCREKVLFSADISGQCEAHRLSMTPWRKREQLLSHRTSGAVIQMLVKQDDLAMLLVTPDGEELCDGEKVITSNESTEADRWTLHPTDPSRLLLFQGSQVQLYNWDGLVKESNDQGVELQLPPSMTDLSIPVDWCNQKGIKTLIQAIPCSKDTAFVRLDAAELDPAIATASLTGATKELVAKVRMILGIYKSKIFFLCRRGWVCSINLDVSAQTTHYARYFFISPLWRSGGEPVIRMIGGNTLRVAIAYRDDLVLFHRFLELENYVYF